VTEEVLAAERTCSTFSKREPTELRKDQDLGGVHVRHNLRIVEETFSQVGSQTEEVESVTRYSAINIRATHYEGFKRQQRPRTRAFPELRHFIVIILRQWFEYFKMLQPLPVGPNDVDVVGEHASERDR
jgi:hypothetical protein